MKIFPFQALWFLAGLVSGDPACAQQPHPSSSQKCASQEHTETISQNVSLLFWNLENLFDYRDDTLTTDEEFTAGGTMHWTYSKMMTKVSRVAKVILASGSCRVGETAMSGDWSPPVIIGLCEVENRYVLQKLVYQSPILPFRYRIIHRDSPDARGIDVALLYRDSLFIPVYSEWIRIRFPDDTAARTRDILYIKGILLHADTLHLFVNHWPSRRGGERLSAPKRNYVASLLKRKVDSLYLSTHMQSFHIQDPVPMSRDLRCTPTSSIRHPAIIIMGDFNDEPVNESLRHCLGAEHPDSINGNTQLVNLMHPKMNKEGSHKFREHWGLLDQFIVSASLVRNDTLQGIRVGSGGASILKLPFLLEYDNKYLDVRPRRTNLGPRYQGGFSDHLPILLQLTIRK